MGTEIGIEGFGNYLKARSRVHFYINIIITLATMATAETSSLGKSVFYDLEDEPDLNLSNSYSGSTLQHKVHADTH